MTKPSQGASALFDAIESGDQALCERLAHENPQWLNATNYKGNTPLLHAIYKEKTAVAKALVEAGSPLEARGRDGYTAVLAAATFSSDLTEWLMSRGANALAKTSFGHTLLTSAALNPPLLPAALRILGPNSLEEACHEGDTSLLAHLGWGEEAAARALLALGAKATAINWKGVGAACASAACDSVDLLRDLITLGADPLLRSHDGIDAMAEFARRGNERACRLLLSLGADGLGVSQHGNGPLAYAIFKNQMELAELIASAGGCFDRPESDPSSLRAVLTRRGDQKMINMIPYFESLSEAADIKRGMSPSSPSVARARL